MNSLIDIDIEKYVLGNLVSEPQVIAQYYNMLSANLFTAPEHQIIYNSIVEVWKKYNTIDLILLGKSFEKKNVPELLQYCIDLSVFAVSSANVEFHIMLLVQASIRRDFVLKFTTL